MLVRNVPRPAESSIRNYREIVLRDPSAEITGGWSATDGDSPQFVPFGPLHVQSVFERSYFGSRPILSLRNPSGSYSLKFASSQTMHLRGPFDDEVA